MTPIKVTETHDERRTTWTTVQMIRASGETNTESDAVVPGTDSRAQSDPLLAHPQVYSCGCTVDQEAPCAETLNNLGGCSKGTRHENVTKGGPCDIHSLLMGLQHYPRNLL
ncbi:hypothetical protein Hte_003390 [Hypoxylon texense]